MVTYDYERSRTARSKEWSWKPIPGPRGTPVGVYDGYVTENGRAELRPRMKETSKGPKRTKEWFLILDGKEYDFHSTRPEFGHVETILRRELGPNYADESPSSHRR